MTPHDFRGAPCIGRWELFDSNHADDHEQARQLCGRCPHQIACDQRLRECIKDQWGTNPGGTWAGRLSGRPIPACGTDSGYHRHIKILKDTPCGPCQEAHRTVARVGQAKLRARKKAAA